jgi:hypothetical protein
VVAIAYTVAGAAIDDRLWPSAPSPIIAEATQEMGATAMMSASADTLAAAS